jgi:hypothetical protein
MPGSYYIRGMEKLSWFLNNEWHQRQAINDAAAEINSLRAERSDAHGAINRLFALDRAQGQELAALRVTVEVLSNLLIESGVVDEKSLRYRIEAAWANQELLEPPAPPPSAYETLSAPVAAAPPPAPEPVPDQPVECARCFEKVPRSRTQITEQGTVCDLCAAR